MKNAGQIIKEVNVTMPIERVSLEDKDRIRVFLSGEDSFEEMRKRIIENHTVKE